MLHDLPDIAIALIVLGAFVLVWRTEGDDPIWRERWRALSPADRARIARAARSGSLLASEDEIQLAAGIALIAGGLVADAPVFVFFGALFLFGGIWLLIKGRRTARNLRAAIARDRMNGIE